jgi:hypothetical protein
MSCKDTNWDQVSGYSKATSVWHPHTESGTGSFLAQIFLKNVYPTDSSSLPSSHSVEENTSTHVTSAGAFYPYSFAPYYAKTYKVENTVTNGLKLRAVSGTTPSSTTITETATKTNVSGGDACTTPATGKFCATRYVHHTLWTTLGTLCITRRSARWVFPAAVLRRQLDLLQGLRHAADEVRVYPLTSTTTNELHKPGQGQQLLPGAVALENASAS